MTQFLTDTLGHLNYDNDSLYKRCECLFIDINGDQNCFPFLAKNVVAFFKSSSFVKNVTQLKSTDSLEFSLNLKNRYDNYLLNRISSFTFEVVYILVTNYFSNDEAPKETIEEHEAFFNDILTHVEQCLDSPNGLQGFCDYFFQSQDENIATEFEAFKASRLLLFLITSSRQNASKNYLIKMFSILNKLFKLHFQLTESKSNMSDKNLKLYTKLCSILSQLNLLANIDGSFLQAWLGKLSSTNLDTNTISSNDTLMSSYTLKQFGHLFSSRK